MQVDHLVAQAPSLAQAVRGHHDLGARRIKGAYHRFDLARRAGIQVRGGLVEEQHLGVQGPGTREREALLLTARQDARRALGKLREPHFCKGLARAPQTIGAADASDLERIDDIGQGSAPQHHGPLEHHRLAAANARPAPDDSTGARRKQPMHESHEHALSRAVRTEDDRARPRVERQVRALDDRPPPRSEGHILQTQRQDSVHP